jgi:putative transposase
MTAPRQVLPGKFWMLTRRCTQRQFLLSPDEELNNAYLYCLIEAAQEFEIVLLLSQMMSNHKHTPFYDPKGNAVEFTHRFDTLLARCVNVHRDRSENMWSSDAPSLVELATPEAVIDELIYTATNPVKAGLVERVHHWPGPKTVTAFLQGRTLRARRPNLFFSADGSMPEYVELKFVMPEQLGDHDEIIARVREGIAHVEETCARERARDGRCVVGRRRILRQSCTDTPTSRPARRTVNPRVAARCTLVRIAALRRYREFQSRYRAAREAWRDGESPTFPAGTYWLRRYAKVNVESPPLVAWP